MTVHSILPALAAALAPAQAAAAFTRCSDPLLAEEACRLSRLSREGRLAALDAALVGQARSQAEAAQRAAAAERSRLSALLRGAPGAAGAAPPSLLRRLLLEAGSPFA